jgi:uncharacterized protein
MIEAMRKLSYTLQNLINYGLSLLFLLFAVTMTAQPLDSVFPPRPEPAVYVNDYSHWLDPVQKQTLEQQLRALHDTTSTQVIVMIRPDIGIYPKEQYAYELGERWGVGKKSKNNGVVILIVTEGSQRGIFIATGYGLEGVLPDVLAARISRDIMVPYFKAGKYYEGVKAGVDAVTAAVHGEFSGDPTAASNDNSLLILFVLFIVIVLIVYFLNRRKGRIHTGRNSYDDPNWPFNSGSGGGIFWGGGSSGGSWGGGSSSGGWDGGSFGGGSFGGGGGGASW